MYPTYRWGDSYPYHVNPMLYAPSDNPRAKEIPSHISMDSSTPNSPYQPWPYGGNYCYPAPLEHHGCCNHNYFGGPYSFQPPYPHHPPPPCHTHGVYPPFPGTYPAYSVPPPHYSVEQPRYDYDKNTHTLHHCCGCTHREDDKRLRIEREEPEVDKKTSDSLVPSQWKNYPGPIMWIPPGYMKNTGSDAKEREKHSHDPVPLRPLEPSKQGGNGEADQDQQGGDGYRLPFPIFWLPSRNDQVGKDTKENNLDQVTRNGSRFFGTDDKKRQPRINDEGSGSEADSETINKHAVQKVIPVKQMGTEEEKKSPEVTVTKAKCDSVEKTDNSAEEKPSSKTSKLPPVCLRIDPLPRKKNGSRSPSPPTDKGRSKDSPTENEKSSQQQTQSSEGLKKSNEEQSKSNIKTIEVIDEVVKAQSHDSCENVARDFGAKGHGEKGNKVEKKKLSEHEAALIIQSVYRGFEVRVSQPLKKLRQIAEVRKQVLDLRNRIQDLESSSSSIHIDYKQKLIIGETIMSLLLKLDTIQGLHPRVRDIRKSVAKELVGLQEKLDSLTFVKPETLSEETTFVAKPNDVPIMNPNSGGQEKSDQAQAHSGSNVETVESATGVCEHHEVEATESQEDGGAEAHEANMEPQVESESQQITGELNNNQLQTPVDSEQPVDDAIQEKSDQAQAQSGSNIETMDSDSGISDNRGVEATESLDDGVAEARDMNLEPQVELESLQSTDELDNNQLQMLVATEQPIDDIIQLKSDRAQAQCGSNIETRDCESDNRGVVATESQDDGVAKAHDMNLEPQVELESQQSTDELDKNQLQMSVVTEQPVDDAIEEKYDQAQPQLDSNVETVESGTGLCEHREVEATKIQHDGGVKTHDIDLDMKSQQSTRELNNDQLQTAVEKDVTIKEMMQPVEVKAELPIEQEDRYQETPKVDDPTEVSMEDLREAPPLSPTGSHDGDGNLIEENERLKKAVEELLKAGKEQLGVITELTGRVKELERKLSRKRKMKTRKCRSRGSVLEDESRSCMV